MATLATINIKAVLDSKGIQQGVQQGQAAISAFGKWASRTFAVYFGAQAIKSFTGWGARLAMEAETAETAFTVLIGSAKEAKAMLSEMKGFASRTPLTFGNLQESGKLLLQFGVAVENVMPVLRMLGDISAGNADRMHMLALAFGQMSAAGRLQGQDLLQMVNAGFNPLQEIAKRTGETMIELRKRMEGGAISAAEVTQAFADATGEGGRFNGMLSSLGPKFVGQWAQFQGAIEDFGRGVGKALAPLLSGALQIGKTFLEIVTPAAQAFLETVVAMLMPTEGMPDIWKQVSFWIEVAGVAASNLISIAVGGWRMQQAAQSLFFTSVQLGIAGLQKTWQQFWGESTADTEREMKRLIDWMSFYVKDLKRGTEQLADGFTGKAGQRFSDRLNELREASANAGQSIGGELKIAATAAADTIKTAFRDITPGALERGSSAAASAILKAQRDSEGNRTEKQQLRELAAIRRAVERGPQVAVI